MSQEEKQVQWVIREAPKGWENLVPEGMPQILGRLLSQRGIQHEEVERFLRPRLAELTDPFEIPEVDLAVDRILRAVDQKERVCIYGDYDVDGVSSIAVLRTTLEAYGLKPYSFIPRRSSEGYGLSEGGLERCLTECGKPDLMISVDCGTVSNDAIAMLKSKGVETVVVDHHEMGPDGRPDCVALVNPKAARDPREYLCAAGVVFKLAHALLKQRPLEGFDLKSVLDLVAVATISDIVPLVDENRLLVRHGLRKLENSVRPGLRALLKLTGTEGRLSSADIGFRIGPRLNAAGRMDQPEQALATLMTGCSNEALDLADELENFNRNRQKLEQAIFAEAMAMLKESTNDPVIVVGSRAWHAGVVGIVASRLMRMYHKPVFVISIDENGIGKGSGRSISGISLVEAIGSCREHLIAGGGHHMAAGLSIHEDSIDAFRESFVKFVNETCGEKDLAAKVHVDAEVELAELSLDFLASYELLQPFGSSNPQPIFLARNVWLTEPPRRLKNNHLRLFLRQRYDERDAIFFGGGANELPDPPWDIAFTVDRNVFRGRVSVQISIQNVRPAAGNGNESD
ncbi:single-stranded-DNA-specific exonuclease RecJ [Akkermansiaceae bacterium]|nr:single-stranded-DNA-specific exonuclease RecJ [Akkermansiaceae bacterium]MDA7908043.1 single-stranded-DNA-specific exonuclease RecJ [Akkermansiaceae bacterium]MDB4509744.1 single-stranded-DNA-specific exonuclease RecJ [Akkermansiaceae bacterium]MDB4509760.1 single-stranded-DNA-specific exonuclease RecJ [Akkermansiaceae bacterium]